MVFVDEIRDGARPGVFLSMLQGGKTMCEMIEFTFPNNVLTVLKQCFG